MPILWGRKPPEPAPACPSCQSAQVVETERHGQEICFRCTNCWWPFVLRTKIVTR